MQHLARKWNLQDCNTLETARCAPSDHFSKERRERVARLAASTVSSSAWLWLHMCFAPTPYSHSKLRSIGAGCQGTGSGMSWTIFRRTCRKTIAFKRWLTWPTSAFFTFVDHSSRAPVYLLTGTSFSYEFKRPSACLRKPR